ncbi:TIGR04222 domain-containing membrane protein [Archangium primigenium]|uniref:TIGR04222 domain-containing membrane protein n=1 Tax=[Archangium] primigenium TaxID=2792470 RepID=UPI00195B8534|nr:TIGR04222 domain-containing membrane protein [Archangium primigenium]MBM7112409.1 TIGR04222 domain-containing membrane protein [Archangium primigenium]
MNPLDWSGPEFLDFYVPLLCVCFVGAWVWKHALNLPSEAPTRRELEKLSPGEVAALEGPATALRAAVAALVQKNTLRLDDEGLSVVGRLSGRATALDRAIVRAVEGQHRSLGAVHTEVAPELRALEDDLREQGLMRTPAQDRAYTYYPWLAFLAVLGLGGVKVVVGVSRDRPVGYLLAVLVLGFAVGLTLCFKNARFTRRGARAQAQLRELHAPLRHAGERADGNAQQLSADNVALAVALFGVGALSTLHYSSLRGYLMPVGASSGGGSGSSSDSSSWSSSSGSSSGDSSSSSSDWSSSSSDSGSSGGDSGGSSCGGGGCGGCGGGGGGGD